jgi:hypothetical protein
MVRIDGMDVVTSLLRLNGLLKQRFGAGTLGQEHGRHHGKRDKITRRGTHPLTIV